MREPLRSRAAIPVAAVFVLVAFLALAAPGDAPDRSGAEHPWGPLPEDAAESLARAADRYEEFALRFAADETVRVAKYEDGLAESESTRRYGYLLVREEDGRLREIRQTMREDGSLSRNEVDDEEPFPPAYAWVFLFSRFHQPYFTYRDRGDRFDGFDWVREIDFRGALPFTDGEDIRQWEGTALVDATTWTPVSITAEPSRQEERIRILFDRWTQAFNLVGVRLAPRPFGYRCRLDFRLRQERLTFPTEMRYDTFRAVSLKRTIPWRASTRTYESYRFFKTETDARRAGE